MASSITRIRRFALVVANLVESELFFDETFDFETLERNVTDPAYGALLGLPDASVRLTRMQLGDQELDLMAFDPSGAPYPAGSTSTDIWFQHFAIIVSDMAKAYARVRDSGRVTPISADGPVLLPPTSGGVTAFKFRDAEGHPLELLAFPEGAAPKAWRDRRGDALFLGIDHSAISVADAARSVAFFETGLGLRLQARTENEGEAQARMDAVPEARVAVIGLVPEQAPPHVELLAYQVGSRRPIAGGTVACDRAATFFVLETRDLASVVDALERLQTRFVSPGIVTLADGAAAIMILDPDGHRFMIVQPA